MLGIQRWVFLLGLLISAELSGALARPKKFSDVVKRGRYDDSRIEPLDVYVVRPKRAVQGTSQVADAGALEPALLAPMIRPKRRSVDRPKINSRPKLVRPKKFQET